MHPNGPYNTADVRLFTLISLSELTFHAEVGRMLEPEVEEANITSWRDQFAIVLVCVLGGAARSAVWR